MKSIKELPVIGAGIVLSAGLLMLFITGCAPSPYDNQNGYGGSSPIPVTVGSTVGPYGSAASTNTAIVGDWIESAGSGQNTTYDNYTFYADGTFSSMMSYGTWSYAGGTLTINFTGGLPNNQTFTGTVSGSTITGSGNAWTASRINSTAYAYGYIQIIDNSQDAVEVNEWYSYDGMTNDVVNASIYDSSAGGNIDCVNGFSSYTKQVTTGSGYLYCYGYQGYYLIQVNIQVYPGQTTTMTIPDNWTYSALKGNEAAEEGKKAIVKNSPR